MPFWRVTLPIAPEWIEAYLPAMEDALSVSWHETDDEKRWRLEALYKGPPDLGKLSAQLALLAAAHQLPLPELQSEQVKDIDWLEATWKSFPPQTIGHYYVYGSHTRESKVPDNLIGLEINAATAFGSGEHETTQGCLRALDVLAKTHTFTHALDMGCGSGILALAIAKTWNIPVLAVDNDIEAVRVTQGNAALNREHRVTALVSEGFADPFVTSDAPYPLIVANILAKPLIVMAPEMAFNLADKGFIILSGLLDRQKSDVLAAYNAQGLSLVQTYEYNHWVTLLLKK